MYRTYMYGTFEGQSLTDVHRSVYCASEQGREQARYEHPYSVQFITVYMYEIKLVITSSAY